MPVGRVRGMRSYLHNAVVARRGRVYSPLPSTSARMNASGLFNALCNSLYVSVTLSAPARGPLSSTNLSRPVRTIYEYHQREGIVGKPCAALACTGGREAGWSEIREMISRE